MTERLPDVWTTRDFPVLVEITRRFDASAKPIHVSKLYEELGWDRSQLQPALHALRRRGLIDVAASKGIGGEGDVIVIRDVAGAAYLMTGLHPDGDDALSSLVAALQQAADQEGDEEERSRLRRAADSLLGVSRDVMVSVMTAYATKYGVH